MVDQQPEDKPLRFAVYALRTAGGPPLVLTDLTFARVMDEVVVPYNGDGRFFIDGAPVTSKDLSQVKVIRQTEGFEMVFHDLHHGLRWGDIKKQELYARQYPVRLEAALRECGEDVTTQMLNAYASIIKPRLRDYLPNREALLHAAVEAFTAALQALR